MRYVNFMIFSIFAIKIRCDEDISSVVDLKSLSLLPLEALLKIKKNIQIFTLNDTDKENIAASSKESGPEALAFHRTNNIKTERGYYVEYVDEESDDKYEKKKDLGKLFQISITTLAFLAFGGYLLFLLITAIKGKNYNYLYDPNAIQIMSAIINSNTRRKKKRPIRDHLNFAYKEEEVFENNEKSKVKREIKRNEINVEEMYQALLNLCEGYSKIEGV